MKKITLLGVCGLLAFAGCRVGPSYTSPLNITPEEWKTPHTNPESIPCVDYWWEVFNDERLNQLEAYAFQNNPNLYVSIERVAEARALAGFTKGNLYPHFNLNPSYTDTGVLIKLYGIPLDTQTLAAGIKPIVRVHEMLYSLPFNMNYEVDLWGKLRMQYESSLYSAQAQAEALQSAFLTLSTDLAADYFNLRSLDAQIILLEESLAISQRHLELAKSRFTKGITNEIDVTTAEYNLGNLEALYQDTVRQRNDFEHAIAALVGVPASCFSLERLPLHEDPPLIPIGIPSKVLAQRPDIAEAERNMASEHAQVGVAYTAFLPSLSLTGALGFVSPDLRNFLKSRSRYWNMEASSTEVLFDGWRNVYNVEASWARFKEASGTYQQQVLTAFREVESALNDVEMLAKESVSLGRAAQAADKRATLSEKRYRQGIANLLEVLDNEVSRIDARRSELSLLGERYLSTVQFIKAIGGNWQDTTQPDCDPKP